VQRPCVCHDTLPNALKGDLIPPGEVLAELTKATALPFTFATTYTPEFKKCEGTFKTATAFSRWANCVRKPENHSGLAPFEVERELGLEARYLKTCEDHMEDAEALSEEKSLDILAKKVSANGTWVGACTSSSEIHYHCRWLVVKGADGSRQIAAFLRGTVIYE
jgi:hypothetical protein